MLKTFFFLILVLTTSVLYGENFEDVTERTFEIQGTPDLVLRNPDGVIQITPRPGSTVSLKIIRRVTGAKDQAHAKKEAERVALEIDQAGNQVRAVAKWQNEGLRLGSRPSIHVRFEVYTPQKSNITAFVSDGELYINGIEGRLDLNTSDGSVSASDLAGELEISASDGSIDLKNGSGTMDLRVSDGDLVASNCSGRVKISSGDGDVQLSGFDGELEISNVDGNVTVDGILRSMNGRVSDGDMYIKVAPGSVMQSTWSLRSSDGEIILDLPDDFSADLEVLTADGHVDSEHPVSLTGRLSSRKLSGKIREGGYLLQIRTSDGHVAIR